VSRPRSINGVGTAGATGDLAFAPGDKFGFYYGVSFSLYYVPFSTLMAEFLMNTPFEVNGLAFQPDGRLYASNKYSLYELDPEAGTSTFIGDHGMSKLNDISSGHCPLVMWPNDREYFVGDALTLTAFMSQPNTRIGLALTSINGSPFFRFLKLARFDSSGTWSQTTTIPDAFAGLEMGLRAFGNHPVTGKLIVSPEIEVAFQ